MKKIYNSPEIEITRLVMESIMSSIPRIGSDDEIITSETDDIP